MSSAKDARGIIELAAQAEPSGINPNATKNAQASASTEAAEMRFGFQGPRGDRGVAGTIVAALVGSGPQRRVLGWRQS
jgi:hypothetical protein